MYQYDPSMTPAFNQRMQAMDSSGRGGQIAGAYAQAANNGFAPPQQAAPQYQGVQMAPAFRPPPGPQMQPRAQFQQRPNPLMGGGDPRAQTMGYMLRGQQPQMAQGFQRPPMGGGYGDPRAQQQGMGGGQLNGGYQAQQSQGFQRPATPTFGGVQMAPAFRPPPSAQQPPSNAGAGLLRAQQFESTRGY